MTRYRIPGLTLTLGLLIAGIVLASGQGERAMAPDIMVNPPGTYPIVDEMVTIDVMTRYSATADDGNYAGGAFTPWFEDLTNVKINFVDIVEAQAWQERLNLVLASGDLPDTIMVQGVMGGQEVFQNGIYGNFMPVDRLIDEWMPALSAQLEAYPEYAAQLVMPNGVRYSFPSLEGTCYHCTMSRKMWIYIPWVEALGLDIPETTEEFYDMLVAFRDRDPNETGRPDTIPLTGAATGAWNSGPLSEYIMSAFIYTNSAHFLKRTDGRLQFVANTNEWRDGVRYMARLYREGLIQPDWFTQDAGQLRATVENPGPPLVGAVPAGWYGVFSINSWDGTGRFADFYPIAPLRGPGGVQHTVHAPFGISHHTVISASARNPEVIARLNDWFYESRENFEIGHWWRWPDLDFRWLTDEERAAGELLARDFGVADFVLLREQTYSEDRFWDGWYRLAPRWEPGGGPAMPPEWATDPTKQEWRLAQATRNLYEPYRGDHDLPPNLIVADDLQDELADLRTLILGVAGAPGLVQQFYAEFVTGSRDIDSNTQWQTYVDELRRAGVNRYLEIMQATVEAAGY